MKNKGFWYGVKHRNDKILHVGYDYHNGNLLRRSLSNVLYLDEKRGAILDYMSEHFEALVDMIKHVKKTFNFTLDKDYIDFN